MIQQDKDPIECPKCHKETFLIAKPVVGLVSKCINCHCNFHIKKITRLAPLNNKNVFCECEELSEGQLKELAKSGLAERYDSSREL